MRKNTASLFIQAMDLGLIVPACILSGILLLRRHAWGYLLASVELVIFSGMALAGVVMHSRPTETRQGIIQTIQGYLCALKIKDT